MYNFQQIFFRSSVSSIFNLSKYQNSFFLEDKGLYTSMTDVSVTDVSDFDGNLKIFSEYFG